jgi:hypothetical protein
VRPTGGRREDRADGRNGRRETADTGKRIEPSANGTRGVRGGAGRRERDPVIADRWLAERAQEA